MPRKIIPPSPYQYYHITGRRPNRREFPTRPEDTWRIFSDQLWFSSKAFDVSIQSFILMPNHFHLIAKFPALNMPQFMQWTLRETSREINRLSGNLNQNFGSRYFRSLLSSDFYFLNAYKYLYRNSVRAGLSKRVEDYEYSTLKSLLGLATGTIPLATDTVLFCPNFCEHEIAWLNEDPDEELENVVRKSLRYGVATYPRDFHTGDRHYLEFHRI